MPSEVQSHFSRAINFEALNHWGYDKGDDIIVGSAEEDMLYAYYLPLPLPGQAGTIPMRHFWDPDDPDTLFWGNDDYNDGIGAAKSNYYRSRKLWENKLLKYYKSDEQDKEYYWLGHLAHLLEDAAVPAHMHLDAHIH